MSYKETTYTRYQNIELERDSGKASLYIIDNVKYWIPNSAHLYYEDQEAIDVADWFSMEPAGNYTPSAKPAAKPQPKGTSDFTDRCPHCQRELGLLNVWQEKGEPEQGLRGRCTSCQGLFEATPRTVFTVIKFYVPAEESSDEKEKVKTEKELEEDDYSDDIPF
jgi:hypothetical protein